MPPDDDKKPAETTPPTITERLLGHAISLAQESEAAALFVYVDALAGKSWTPPEDLTCRIFLVSKEEPEQEDGEEPSAAKKAENEDERITLLHIPNVAMTRFGQVKIGVLLALTRNLLTSGDRLVCVSGGSETPGLDTLLVVEVGREFDMFIAPEDQDGIAPLVMPEVLTRVIDIAAELGSEGREGRAVGAIFVVGDTEAVLNLTRPLVLNPFRGYDEHERNLLDPKLEETIKEYSFIDGAFIIRGDGVIESAGAYLKTSGVVDEELPRGLGARHQAAAAITSVTDSIAVTVSQSTGTVTIFRGGRIVTEIEKPRRIRGGKKKRGRDLDD